MVVLKIKKGSKHLGNRGTTVTSNSVPRQVTPKLRLTRCRSAPTGYSSRRPPLLVITLHPFPKDKEAHKFATTKTITKSFSLIMVDRGSLAQVKPSHNKAPVGYPSGSS